MIDIIQHDKVRELRLNRPPVNALNVSFIQALTNAIEEGAAEAGALVLSGRPGMFSAGLDVPALLQLGDKEANRFIHDFFGLMKTLARSPVPIACALTGHSPAGGTVLALFTDYRVMCAGKYKMGLNEVQVGLPVPETIFKALVRLVGQRKAERLVVAGQLISPDAAFEAGLVDQLADDPEATIQAAINWCTMVNTVPRHAMLATRKVARADLAALFDNFGEADIEQFTTAWFDPRTQTALNALVERLGKK